MKLYLQLSMEQGVIDICPCKVERVETICRAEFNSLLGNPALGTQWALEGDPRFRERFEDVYRGVMVLNSSDEQGVFVYNAGAQFAYLPNAKALVKETVDKNWSREWPFKGTRFCQTLKISQNMLETINGYLNADSPEKYQGEDNTIIHTVEFPDGKQMDIKCCGCKDAASWTEAVLFDCQGHELAFTKVCGEYLGLWELDNGDVIYTVDVVADGGDTSPVPALPPIGRGGICPICEAGIEYQGLPPDRQYAQDWICPRCGATGVEESRLIFSCHSCVKDGHGVPFTVRELPTWLKMKQPRPRGRVHRKVKQRGK